MLCPKAAAAPAALRPLVRLSEVAAPVMLVFPAEEPMSEKRKLEKRMSIDLSRFRRVVSVVNLTKGSAVLREAGVAETFWARFKGLMLTENLPERTGLILEPCSSIHMLFMRYPIDVIFTDYVGVVVKVEKRVMPWRMAVLAGGRAARAIECPEGTIESSGTEVGDILAFMPRER